VSLLKFLNRQENKQNNVVHTFFLDFSKSSAFWSDSKKKKKMNKKMDNRNRLRVQNKKPIKRSGKKPLVKKFLDYLKSDTFLYAPLLSPQPFGSPSPNNFKGLKLKLNHHFLFIFIVFFLWDVNLFMITVVELKKPIKERHWFKEYLKSQGYMYDPVLELPLSRHGISIFHSVL